MTLQYHIYFYLLLLILFLILDFIDWLEEKGIFHWAVTLDDSLIYFGLLELTFYTVKLILL